MVELKTGPFQDIHVICNWCHEPLLLESKTDYKKCVRCGGLYIDPNDKIFAYSESPRVREMTGLGYFLFCITMAIIIALLTLLIKVI